MGWLEFIASIVGSLAWPAAVVFIVFFLRHQIRELIPRLARVQAGSFAAEFDRGLDRAQEIGQQVEEEEALPPIEETDERLIANRDMLYARAQESPKEAVYDAWLLVQAEAHAAAMRNGLDRSTGLPLRRTVEMLANQGNVARPLVDYTGELERLHRETLQTQAPVTEGAATRYVELAERLISYLNRA